MTLSAAEIGNAAEQRRERLRMLDFWLSQFRVGPPLDTLVNPRFRIIQDITSEVPILHLTISAPDADCKRPGLIDVMLHRPIHPMCHDYELYRMMRGMLHEILMHETDEAIQVNGVKIFDPHRPRPPMEDNLGTLRNKGSAAGYEPAKFREASERPGGLRYRKTLL